MRGGGPGPQNDIGDRGEPRLESVTLVGRVRCATDPLVGGEQALLLVRDEHLSQRRSVY